MTTLTTHRVTWLAALAAVACAPRQVVAPQTGPTASISAVPATSLATAPDRYFTNGDVRLRYREIGQGEPVILLHGITRSLEDWIGNADSLARDYRVIALDERGHGKSTKFTEPSRYGAAMTDDVVRLLDHLGIARAHLVGHSMGALVAANVAARYPTRIISASLIAPPTAADSATYAKGSARWVSNLESGAGMADFLQWLFPGLSDSAASAWSAETLRTNPPATVAAVQRSMAAMMIPASVAATARVPLLVAVATGDPLMERGRWIASVWPHARLIVVDGANHDNITRRPEVWAAVRANMRAR